MGNPWKVKDNCFQGIPAMEWSRAGFNVKGMKEIERI